MILRKSSNLNFVIFFIRKEQKKQIYRKNKKTTKTPNRCNYVYPVLLWFLNTCTTQHKNKATCISLNTKATGFVILSFNNTTLHNKGIGKLIYQWNILYNISPPPFLLRVQLSVPYQRGLKEFLPQMFAWGCLRLCEINYGFEDCISNFSCFSQKKNN